MNGFPPRRLAAGLLVLCLVFLGSCDYLGYYTRKQHWSTVYESQPSMKVLKRLAPEDSLLLGGKIGSPDPERGPLLFMAVCNQFRKNEIVATRTIDPSSGEYSVLVPPCDYDLYLFADLDRNGVFERDELVGRTPPEFPVVVSSRHARDGAVVEGPTLAPDFKRPQTVGFRVRVRVRTVSYVYPSLDDDFFDPKFGDAGLYNPAALIAHTQGFLFGLEDYDSRKTTVLFVHGIAGTPRDWKFFAEGLDRSRFQPFFFYYPTGLPLDKLGSVLAQTIDSLVRNGEAGERRVVLAAHSLGGLVALSAIQKLRDEGLASPLRMFVSFSTPFGGDDQAHAWLESMPAVVPAWRDIARGSDFLDHLAGRPFPKTLPFHLFFSYNDPSMFKLGESSDGVASLRSQLEPRVQAMTTRLFGFNETHAGMLASKDVRDMFLQLIEQAAPPRSEGTAP